MQRSAGGKTPSNLANDVFVSALRVLFDRPITRIRVSGSGQTNWADSWALLDHHNPDPKNKAKYLDSLMPPPSVSDLTVYLRKMA
jgi:hypothetical protein